LNGEKAPVGSNVPYYPKELKIKLQAALLAFKLGSYSG